MAFSLTLRLTTAAFGTLMSLEPAIALVVGLLLLDQVPGWVPVVGTGLVVLAGIGAERTGARLISEVTPTTATDASTDAVPTPAR